MPETSQDVRRASDPAAGGEVITTRSPSVRDDAARARTPVQVEAGRLCEWWWKPLDKCSCIEDVKNEEEEC